MRAVRVVVVLAAMGCVQNQITPAETPECEAGADGRCVDSDGDGGSSADPRDTDADADDPGDGNRPPRIDGVQILPAGPHYNDSTLTCEGAATDPDGNLSSTTYTWLNQRTGDTLGTLATLALTSALALPGDTVRCVFRAEDAEGLGAEAEAEVTMGNRAPAITSGPSISPSTGLRPDSALSCEAVASDPDGTEPELRYAWHNHTTGDALGGGAELALSWYVAEPGDEIACAAVADDGELQDTATSSVVLGGGSIPAGQALPSEVAGELRYIAPGSFTMGCIEARDVAPGSCHSGSVPPVEVTITQPFVMMSAELTEGVWVSLGLAVTGAPPNSPRASLSWYDALAVANLMSAAEGLPACYDLGSCSGDPGASTNASCAGVSVTAASGRVQDCEGWRLPTEAEWEYAARGGQDLRYAGSDDPSPVARFDTSNGPTPGCSFARNAFGLCDMSGNLAEWVWGSFGTYPDAPTSDLVFAPSGTDRSVRGGSYADNAAGVAVGRRGSGFRDQRVSTRGARFVRTELRFVED